MNKKKISFYTKAACLDALKIQNNPNKETANFLKELFRKEENDSLLSYFFGDLENEEWFPLFNSNEIFKEIFIGKTLNYLNKICVFHPLEIKKLILELIQEKRINGPLLSLLLPNLPPKQIAEIIETVIKCPKGSIELEFLHYKEIILKLIKDAYQDDALEFIKYFIKARLEKPSEPPIIRNNFYLMEDITKTFITLFNSTNLVNLLEFLEEELKNNISSEYDISLYEKYGSVPSSIWRPAIEDHPENSSIKDFKNLTVDAIREILIKLIQSNPDYLKNKLRAYLNDDYSIFSRLAILIIQLSSNHFPHLVNTLVTTKKLLSDPNLFHEIFRFLSNVFGNLSEVVKENIIKLFREGPLNAELNDNPKMAKEIHLMKYLTAIEPYIGENERSELNSLREKYPRRGSYEDFEAIFPGGIVEDLSPKKIDELRNLDMNELVELCKNFNPKEDSFEIKRVSRLGLAREISTLVSEAPEIFAENMTLFIDKAISAEYIYFILEGLEKAWKAGKNYNWDPLLKAFNIIIKKSEIKKADHFIFQDFSEVRKKITWLIWTVLTDKDHSINLKFLSGIRDILVFLCHDPDPTPEYESKYGGTNMSPSDLAIDTIRGSAFRTLITYALYYARTHKTDTEGKTMSLAGKHVEREVKVLLEEKLDKILDPSPAIHSVFGQYFNNLCYLDDEWTKGHLEDIFPWAAEKNLFFKAAWNAYLQFNHFNPNSYKLLKKQYQFAISKVEHFNEGLATHLMAAYWLKVEELEGETYLLPIFFEKAPDEIRAKAIHDIYKWLKSEALTKDSEVWIRLKALWKKRVDFAREREPQKNIMEISSFTFWLKFIPESIKDCFEIIEKMIPIITVRGILLGMNVIEYFSNQSNSYPLESIKLLYLYFQNYSGDYFTFVNEKERIRLILSNAIKLTSKEANSIAFDLINLFAEKFKIYDFKELLSE